MIDFKILSEQIVKKISSLNILLWMFTFFVLTSHNVLTAFGVEMYSFSSIPILLDVFGESIIDSFLSKTALFTLLISLVIVIIAKVFNKSIFVLISIFSKYSINSLYEECKKRICTNGLDTITVDLQRTDKNYWSKKIKSYLTVSTLVLILIFLSSYACFQGYLPLWSILLFPIFYVILYVCIFIIVIRYYVFCLALDSVRKSIDFIASKSVRELVE